MASNDKISLMTAAVAGDVAGSAGRIEMTKAYATAPVTLGLDFGVLRTSMFAGSTGYTATDPITAGAASFTTGTFSETVGIGTAAQSQNGLRFGGTITAVSTNAMALAVVPVLAAAANNDKLRGATITPTFTPGAYTGLAVRGIFIGNLSIAGFTSPADIASIEITALTGTGATNAYGLLIGAPTGATNNYLISHTMPATFSVTAAGAITGAGNLTVGASTFVVTAATGAVTSGTINGQTISATASFTGSLAITGALTGVTNETLSGYIEGTEMAAPAAPAANTGRIFFQDNGAGKTQLMCIFASGAAQQLAIEP